MSNESSSSNQAAKQPKKKTSSSKPNNRNKFKNNNNKNPLRGNNNRDKDPKDPIAKFNVSFEYQFDPLAYEKNLIYNILVAWGKVASFNQGITFNQVKHWIIHTARYSDQVSEFSKKLYNVKYDFNSLIGFLDADLQKQFNNKLQLTVLSKPLKAFNGTVADLMLLFNKVSEEIRSAQSRSSLQANFPSHL